MPDNASSPASALRFLVEVIAWVAAPWALAGVSVALAVAAPVILIALPTLFATPGDKKQIIVAVPGSVTIALVALHMAVAAVAAWFAWPLAAAIVVWVLVAASLVAELPRWRRLLTARAREGGVASRG